MVTVVKSEWHQIERRFGFEFDEDIIAEIYPDLDEEEIDEILEEIQNGERSIEDIIEAASANNVDLDWDWLDEDDMWTDRKGGYEVTYEVQESQEVTELTSQASWPVEEYVPSTKNIDVEYPVTDTNEDEGEESEEVQWPFPMDKPNELKPNAKWPFENAVKPEDDDEDFLEDLKVLEEAIEADSEETLPNYPAGEYTIRIWGRTREIGVGTITKAQYDYWSSEDHEDDLADALNESFDYDEAGTPPEAQFEMPYYEYQDVESIWGFDTDDTSMTIEDSEGNDIYSGDLVSFIEEAHGNNDSAWDASEEIGELYPEHFEKGTYVFWTQGGKGSCIQCTIDTDGEEFDPRKLKIKTYDIQGQSLTSCLVYDDVELGDEGMDNDNWRGQWSEFSVHKVK
jgi:hypothetical protein